MKTSPKSQLCIAVLIASVSLSGQAQTVNYSYDAALGTFPEAQGFTRTDAQVPPPTVTNGVLHTRPATLPDGLQYWFRTNAPLDFLTTPYVMEADLHIISANYVYLGGGAVRSGYYLGAVDHVGRHCYVGIAGNGITVHTAHNFVTNQTVGFIPFNTRDGFHRYRFTIESGTGSLFIDGILFASVPIGPAGVSAPEVFNRVTFGDASGRGTSEAELRSFRFAHLDPHATIEISEVRVCWKSLTNRMYQIQYRSELTTNMWAALGTPVAGNNTETCVTDAVVGPRRFYQVLLLP